MRSRALIAVILGELRLDLGMNQELLYDENMIGLQFGT